MNILFVFPNIDIAGYKPIGISSLISIAKKMDHKVKLFDTSFCNVNKYSGNEIFLDSKSAGEEVLNFIPVDLSPFKIQKEDVDIDLLFEKTLEEFRPDIIALSIVSQEYSLGMYLLKIAKRKIPEITSIVGGIHCYADPEHVISNPYVDFMCLGEGEEVFENFLQRFNNPLDCWEIDGLWSKDENGLAIKRYPTQYVRLNQYPFLDYDEYDDRQFIRAFNGGIYRSADICLTRGCFEKCIYCLHAKIYQIYNSSRIRHYDVERFIEELVFLKNRHNLNFIRFQDSSFLNISETFLRQLCRTYIQNIGLPFVIDSTPQNVTDEKIRLLKDMNCQSISLGIETGNEGHRRNYLNKNVSNEVIIKAYKTVHKYNIRTVGFVLLGFPFETRKDFFETISLVKKVRVSAPNVGFVYPFKGTKLREIVIKNGLFNENIENNDTPQYSRNYPAIKNDNISTEEYRGLYRTFPLYCKLPGKYYPEIRKAESFDSAGNRAFNKLKSLYVAEKLYDNYLE